MIDKFDGEYAWLSNFYDAPVIYNGRRYLNSESAFQAAKCPGREQEFENLKPGQAKRLGRRIGLRQDWDAVKDGIMYEVCAQKFLQNPALLRKLIDTGNEELIEGNTWGDRYWGVCDGIGKNHLGKILMKLRDELSAKV